MAMTVIKKCSKCLTVFETGTDSRGIGVPYKVCKNCGTYIIDKDDTEWELKNLFEKIWYLFILVWTSILFGLLAPLIFVFLREYQEIQITDNALLWMWFSFSLLLLCWLFYKHSVEIRESKVRMENIDYREILKKLGLLKE